MSTSTKDLNESIKVHLGQHTKILVKYMVKLELKGDKKENKVLVFTPVRTYLFVAKIPTKIENHFHYLDIQAIESKDPTHFSIVTNDRVYSFTTIGDATTFSSNTNVILTDLVSAIKQIFPTIPLKYIIKKINIQPSEREAIFSDELRPSDPRNVGPCGGFSIQYACMCDFHGVSYREEVAWDINTIYLSHDSKILNLRDFDHLESRDLMAVVSTLEYNTFFRGLKASNLRLSHETLERTLHVLKRSMWLEELHFESLGLRSDFIQKLALSVITNNYTAIRIIDLSHNLIEDKGAVHLAGPIAKLPKGLCKLSLSHCGLTSKSVNQIAHSLSLNQSISSSLTYLDLSENNLKDDITNLHNFLAQPNVIEYLNLSTTDITLENLFGALLRGCSTHLAHLNVSHNSFSTKKGKEIPPSFKQFFTSTLSLKHINIAGCKLPLEALKNLLLGLACNESTAGLYLDLSSNCLGAQGSHVLESCIHGVRVLQSLNIGDNNLDLELASVLTAISKNPSVKSLNMSRSFAGIKPKHTLAVMEILVSLIQKDDFQLTELILSDNKLKNDMHDFINALGSNQCLQKLDISGNYIGDVGARLLAKAFQINNKLRTVILDKNNISLQGYLDIIYGLENNFSVRSIPFPIFDVTPYLKSNPEKTDMVMRKMQDILQRNCNGLKRTTEQNFRLQHDFMLTSTHQLVDKFVSETKEMMLTACENESNEIQKLIDDAENCKLLMSKLQEAIRCDSSHQIEIKLMRVVNDLAQNIKEYLNVILETMIRTGVEQCPRALGNQSVIDDLRKTLNERLIFPDDFLRTCLLNNAGGDIMNKINEIEQTLAVVISDRATDEVLDALTRCRRGIKISGSTINNELQTPDIVRNRFSNNTESVTSRLWGINVSKLGADFPTATPYLFSKRRFIAQKIRPHSVVENLSLGHIPDLLESPSSQQHSSKHSTARSGDEYCDSISELPSTSLQLQHLVKGRPKRMKTRAPTRPLLLEMNAQGYSDGLEQFFRPGSVTPTTLTPVISPTSDECSSLSFVDSPTLSRDENGKIHNLSSEETTPIFEERKLTELDQNSPFLKGGHLWDVRSRSSDNLEKYMPSDDLKLYLNKVQAENNKYSASTESLRSHLISSDVNNVSENAEDSVITPTVLQKQRPWSVVCNEDFSESNKTTSQQIDIENDVVPFGQNDGGSIIGISPGNVLSTGGSVIGITPGAVLEKKSSRELTLELNKGGDIS